MFIGFPDFIDFENLDPIRSVRNSSEFSKGLGMEDLLYIINEIEKKIGARGSCDINSMDYRIGELENLNKDHRTGKHNVVLGSNFIPFTEEFTAEYIPVACYCIDPDGAIEYLLEAITLKTTNGFGVNVGLQQGGVCYYSMKAIK